MSPPTTFPQFSKLPLELRHEIWRHALPRPRINVYCAGIEYLHIHYAEWWNLKTTASLHPPALLSVCREARMEALRHYTVRWPTSLPPQYAATNPRIKSTLGMIYLDPCRDTVYFHEGSHSIVRKRIEELPCFMEIRHLAICLTTWTEDMVDPLRNWDLKSLTVVRKTSTDIMCEGAVRLLGKLGCVEDTVLKGTEAHTFKRVVDHVARLEKLHPGWEAPDIRLRYAVEYCTCSLENGKPASFAHIVRDRLARVRPL